jgi:negative regulator of sigma E activity
MPIHTYPIFHKDLRSKYNLIWSAVLAFLLWTPHTLFADISTLERIVEAERKVAYVGARLRTSSSSRGTRTFEEVVIHKSADASYRKVVSVVGERKSFEGSRDRNERRNDSRQRDNNENRRDRRDRNRDRNEWRQIRSPFSKKEIELIAQNYNLEESASTEKTANYETNILTITPKFAGRPTKRIFFARENGVILRVEDLDAEGVLREMFVYNRISFDPEVVERKWEVFQKEIKPKPRRSHSISIVEAEKMLKTKPIQPEYMPPGFQLQDVRSIRSKENNSILLEYTDGLVNFTLFEKAGEPPRLSDRQPSEETEIELGGKKVYKHRFGSTDAFRWSGAKIHFFLIGAMPDSEMQKVVESIIHNTKQK